MGIVHISWPMYKFSNKVLGNVDKLDKILYSIFFPVIRYVVWEFGEISNTVHVLSYTKLILGLIGCDFDSHQSEI